MIFHRPTCTGHKIAYFPSMPPRPTPAARILAILAKRGPLRRCELAHRAKLYPVERLDDVLAALIAGGQVAEESRKPARGPAATIYRLSGNGETQP
jgi:predicted ArsR family transcriptional regulator